MVLFVIGLKISSYPFSKWQTIYSQSPVEIQHLKYLPGGIIFATLGLFLLKFILKIRLSILDSLVLSLPLVGMLQRVDCLLSGCCYGKPTQLPWAIHYSNISPAYTQEVSEGLISETATSSLGIHPTQLYYIIGFLLVFLLLLIYRKKLQSPGSLALLGLILMAVSRFVIEFFREPVQNRFSSFQWAGVNLLQWVIMTLVIVSAFVLYHREKHFKPKLSEPFHIKEYLLRTSFILFISALLVWNFSRILAYSEFFFLQVLLAISIVVVGMRLFQKSTIPALQYPILATLLLAGFIMSQKSTDTIINADSVFYPKNWWDVKASAGGGKYDQINYDCNGNETGRIPERYSIVSGGTAYNYKKSQDQLLQAGLNLGRFYDSGNTLANMSNSSTTINNLDIYFLNPYFKYDFHKVGFGLGYNFFLSNDNQPLPSLYFRGGKREKIFFDLNFMDNFYSTGLAGQWQFGMGSGFDNPDKHLLRIGISSMWNKALGYVEGNFLLYDRLHMQAYLGIGNKFHGSLGLQYQVGGKR